MPFENPTRKPFLGNFTWYPTTLATGASVPTGFLSLGLENGKFRNDVVDKTVKVSYKGELKSSKNSFDFPFVNAFRLLANPASFTKFATNTPFTVDGTNALYSIDLNSKSRLSAIKIVYTLSISPFDPKLSSIVDAADYQEIVNNRNNPEASFNVDMNKYVLGTVLIDGKEYPDPKIDSNKDKLELKATGLRNSDSTILTQRETTIRFGNGVVSTDFSEVSNIQIKVLGNAPSVRLSIYKIYLFDAQKVNLRDEQVPCNVLSYAFPALFNYNPTVRSLYFPTSIDFKRPNLHVKLFDPTQTFNSPGFAHSVSLRFLIFSWPITLLDPLAILSMGQLSGSGLYFTRIITTIAESKQLNLSFLNQNVSSKSRILSLPKLNINDDWASIQIQVAPKESDEWSLVHTITSTLGNTENFLAPYIYRFENNTGFSFNDIKFRAFVRYPDGSTYQESIVPELDHYNSALIMNEETLYSSTDSSEHSGKPLLINPSKSGDFSMNAINALDPILFFVSDDKFNYEPSILASQGAYTFKVTAKVIDKLNMANTHIIARIWFVPKDFVPSTTNFHQYRDVNEIIFKYGNNVTQAQIGKPSSLDEVFVSSSISSDFTFIDLVRYAAEVKGFQVSGSTSYKLCVGIYAISSLNDEYKNKKFSEKELLYTPTVVFDLSSTSDGVQTPIQRAVTATLYPRKASEFDSAKYTKLSEPFIVSKNLVNGTEVGEYILYKGIAKTNSDNAFQDLLIMQDEVIERPLVRLYFDSFAESFNPDLSFSFDFCTLIRPLNSAKVDLGTWQISIKPSTLGMKIETFLNFKISYEIFDISLDGNIVERIYKSGYLNKIYDLKFDIAFPFLTGNNNSQLILRINLYPYALLPDKSLGDIRTDFGFTELFYELESIEITSHTVKFLDLDAADSKLGSPGFYEDLDLVPGIAFDDSSCWFILDDDLKNTMITTITDGLNVSGCLYSPTWQLSMPNSTEVRAGALGYTNKDFWFRTVPGEAEIGEISVTAVEDNLSFSTHVAFDDPSTAITFSDGRNYVKYFSTNSNELNFFTKTNLAGMNGEATVEIKGNNPQLFTMNNNNHSLYGNKSLGLLLGQTGEQTNSVDGYYNFSAGRERSWSRIGFDSEDNSFNNSSKILNSLNFASTANSMINDLTHIVGILENNKVVYSLANPTIVFSNGVSENRFVWIAGTKTSENSNFLIHADSQDSDSPENTFPGIALDKYGNVFVCYSSASSPGSIFGKTVNNEIPSEQFPIIEMKNSGILIPSTLKIKGLNLQYNHIENTYCLAFWCAGRIFVAIINPNHDYLHGSEDIFSITPILSLVAGSRTFDSANNSLDSVLQAMVSKGYISVKQSGEVETNVPSQKPGLLISNNPGKQGELHIWYKDSQDKLKSRILFADGNVNNSIGYA